MSKILKRITTMVLCVILTAVGAVGFYAATIIRSNGFILKVEDDDTTALDGWESEGVLRVPNSVDHYYISGIADYAFMDNASLTGLDLSQAYTLKKIGYMAFKGCSEITGSLVIPSRITSLGMGAFQECSSLTSAELYSGSAEVPAQMFYHCDLLTDVTINYGFNSIGRLAFANCANLKSVQISWTVTNIHSNAFYNCPELVIYCYSGSYAQQYAAEKGIDYVLIDAVTPTEPFTEEPTAPATEPETEAPAAPPTEPVTDEPTQPETEDPTSKPTTVTFLLGDADGNGKITVVDATRIQRVLAEIDEDPDGMLALRATVDSDKLTIIDATLIQRYLAFFDDGTDIGAEVTRTIG